MWFGIGWRFNFKKAFEIVAGLAIVTYVAGWFKGKDSAEKGK